MRYAVNSISYTQTLASTICIRCACESTATTQPNT